MPYKKQAGKEFFSGANFLKKYWKQVLNHIDSTPKDMIRAIKWLSYLSAETEIDKKLTRLELIIDNAARIGYKIPENVNLGDDKEAGEELDKMLALLGGKK